MMTERDVLQRIHDGGLECSASEKDFESVLALVRRMDRALFASAPIFHRNMHLEEGPDDKVTVHALSAAGEARLRELSV
jgi:hypothetical protein